MKLVYDNITVVNNEGQKSNLILELSEDKKVVFVKPPSEGYKQGSKYKLTISDKLQSLKGKKLRTPVSISFVIEEPVYIASIKNINLSIKEGQAFTPPKKVSVDLSNGKQEDRDIVWNSNIVDTTKPGIKILTGKVEGYKSEISLTLTILKVEINYNELVKASIVIAEQGRDTTLYNDMTSLLILVNLE